jgi:uncharacterized protein (TIGR03083 family)
MKDVEPVLVADLFPEDRAQLLALLSSLSEAQWQTPTVCEGWSVKDVALHLLGVDLGVLSRKRDKHTVDAPGSAGWDVLVTFLNDWNEAWVRTARRISSRLLVSLLEVTGRETHQYFNSLDLSALGEPVSWAGPEPAPVWLDVAREYTERWLHQQHIRDAVDRPGMKEPRFFAPVLETFVRALPHTFREVEAADGTHVRLAVSGEAGGAWSLVKEERRWVLGRDVTGLAHAEVIVDQDTAWRLLTKGLTKDQAVTRCTFEGDRSLGTRVLDTVSIIA